MASSRSPDSSPDPLSRSIDRLYPPSSPLKYLPNTTPQRHRTSKPNISRQSSPSKPRNSSPVKHHDVSLERGDSVVLTTPAKTRDGAGGRKSPLKIRLTVETDPDEEQSGFEVYEKTTTIIVPLKGEDEHQPVKRRMRRRKSLLGAYAVGTEIVADHITTSRLSPAKRSARANQSILAVTSPGAKDVGTKFGTEVDTVETPGIKPRGRPRKSTAMDADTINTNPAQMTAAAGRPKRITRMNFAELTPLHLKQSALPPSEDGVFQLTPWEVRKTRGSRAAQKIRERVPTPRKPTGWDDSTMTPDSLSSAVKPMSFTNEDLIGRGSRSKRTRSALASDDPFSDAPDHDCAGEDADAVTGTEDDTTMLDRSAVESEGFSMVSIDSLRPRQIAAKLLGGSPSSHASHSKPRTRTGEQPRALLRDYGLPRSPPTSSPTTAPFDLRSGEGVSRDREKPDLKTDEAGDAPTHVPELVAATATGDILQTSEAPKPLLPSSEATIEHDISAGRMPPGMKTRSNQKRKSDDGVFDAFGVATKRHLRAGLAMGELLARNEAGFLGDAARANESSVSEKQTVDNNVSESVLDNQPRLPTPAASVESGSGPVSAQSTERPILGNALERFASSLGNVRQNFSSSPPRLDSSPIQARQPNESSPALSNVHDRTDLGRTELLEREYQHEREDVIRQIQAANTSQVIRIDSDDVDEDGDHVSDDAEMQIDNEPNILLEPQETIADIWREEADRSLEDELPTRPVGERKSPPKPQIGRESPPIDFADLFAADLKPSRAKLPRTWRRVSGKDFHYSDEAETPAHPAGEASVAVGAASVTTSQLLTVKTTQRSPRRSARSAENASRGQSSHQTRCSSPPKLHPVNRSSRRNRASDANAENATTNAASTNSDMVKNLNGGEDAMAMETHPESRSEVDQTPPEADTSDVRQLTRELNLSAGPKVRRSLVQSKLNVSATSEGKHDVLQPKGKKYEKLFDTVPKSSVTKLPAIPAKAPQIAAADHPKQIAEDRSESFPQPTKVAASTTNVVSRMVSWLFSAPNITPDTDRAACTNHSSPAANPPPPPQRIWTRNHYLLLDHYYSLSLSLSLRPTTTEPYNQANTKAPPPKGPPMPPAYFAPFSELPTPLTQHLNLPVTTHHPSLHPLGTVSEHWLRVAHAFLEVARERGIPALCDGALEQQSSTQPVSHSGKESVQMANKRKSGLADEYPKRGPDGRVLRIREDWCGGGGEWEVLRRVYSLWVRDQLASGSADEPGGARPEVRGGGDDAIVVDEEVLREAERRTVMWVEQRV